MILRKPYAFIIKHFRLIHLIILGCLIYIVYNFSNIGSLVNTLINSRTYTYAGADVYINTPIYYFILVALVLSGILYWLLRLKKKPTGLYIGLITYLIVTFVSFMYFYSILNKMTVDTIEVDVLSTLRDLLVLVRVPGYIFIGLSFIRGIGFDIKQFNFSKDVAELKLAEEDSEEFELMVGQNNYKYERYIRRTLREIKYYIKENLVPITIIGIVLLGILIILGIRYYNIYLKRIKAREVSSVNGIAYVVNRSYITSEDYNGNKIKEGSKFVVVDMSFNNTTNKDASLDFDRLSLVYKELKYNPSQTYISYFYDLGIPYTTETLIPAESMLQRYIVFEIPETMTTTDFTLRVEYGITSKDSKVLSNYIKFQVDAVNIDTEDRVIKTNINETINTDVVNENRFSLTINGYNIQENYNDKYVICNKELKCQRFNTLVTANAYNKMTMLAIDIDGMMYDEAKFTKTFTTYNSIFEGFAYIDYIEKNREYTERVNIVPLSNVEGKVFLLIDRRLLNADKINLIFKFRNNTYVVPLKA